MLVRLLVVLLMILTATAQAAPKTRGTIVFVPLDDRPVCKNYTVETLQAAGWDIKLPPAEYISSYDRGGKPDQLLDWLENEATTAVAIVASSDALTYGGLVDSRTHHYDASVVKSRAERIIHLKNAGNNNPNVYIFTTIMRSPRASSAPVEPIYYGEWGRKIFRLGELLDKEDLKEIKRKEKKELDALKKEIPSEYLKDMFDRRELNFSTTELLLHGVETGDFDYMLIGRDDTAPYSQAHKEARAMDILVTELPKERIRFFSGADQLGLILLNRAVNKLNYEYPFVEVLYAKGKGGETIPTYEDDTVAVSAREHILAAGGIPTRNRNIADLVLAINTPLKGITHEANTEFNTQELKPYQKGFMNDIKKALADKKPVAVADIAFGNGADNGLINALREGALRWNISSYSGWNTAGNSLGFTLGQGLLSRKMELEDRYNLIAKRYLDDWAYQSNVRGKIYREIIWPEGLPNQLMPAPVQKRVEDILNEDIHDLAETFIGTDMIDQYKYSLPWHRMFEVEVTRVSK